jgi:hypothetical protein
VSSHEQGDLVPSYEGRALARPDEEVVDQGLGFDVGTLLGRRRVLRSLGLGAPTIGLAACGSSAASGSTSSTSPGEIPDETAGPYPGDGAGGPDVLEESGIVRSDIRSSFGAASGTAAGVPMTLERVQDQNYLRGVQIADAGWATTERPATDRDHRGSCTVRHVSGCGCGSAGRERPLQAGTPA